MEWLESIAGPTYASALMWTGLALLGLVVVLLLVRLMRSFGSGTFVSGGRNRKARLAIMDAAAVDNQRRLVLIRRDDVEHLILIGGSNDVVVERDIRLMQPTSPRLVGPDPDAQEAAAPQRQQVAAAPRPAPVQPERAAPPQRREPIVPPPAGPVQRPEPAPAPYAPEPVAAARAPEPVAAPRQVDRPVQAAAVASPATTSAVPPPPIEAPAAIRPAPAQGFAAAAGQQRTAPTPQVVPDSAPASERLAPQIDVDDDLLQELQLTLEQEEGHSQQPAPAAREARVDDEMDRLLGELSGHRR